MSGKARLAFLLSVLFVGLSLGPALAHLFALPNKVAMGRDDYAVAQAVYAGWSLLGIVVYAALAATLWLAFLLRRKRRGSRWALTAFLCLVAAHALFWIVTYPANVATANWTALPTDWEALRLRWEYAHAAGALLTLAALLSLAAVPLARLDRPATRRALLSRAACAPSPGSP